MHTPLVRAEERVMTDSGPGLPQRRVQRAAGGRRARHIHMGLYSPWQNEKVERMNRTIAQERQHARTWGSEAERADALPAFIERYNWERPHSACGGLPLPYRASSV